MKRRGNALDPLVADDRPADYNLRFRWYLEEDMTSTTWNANEGGGGIG